MPVTPGSGGVRAIFQRSHWSGGTSGGVERIGFFSCRSCTRPPRQATPRHSFHAHVSGHAMCKELSQSCTTHVIQTFQVSCFSLDPEALRRRSLHTTP